MRREAQRRREEQRRREAQRRREECMRQEEQRRREEPVACTSAPSLSTSRAFKAAVAVSAACGDTVGIVISASHRVLDTTA
jgi:hypothetical protein